MSHLKTIAKKIPAKSFSSNTEAKQSYRIIGTTDINGKGTEHELADVDPFIFLDETWMRGNEAWPFPKHPHAGLIAMTYLISGELAPWDNKQGKNPKINRAGGVYYIFSGDGILHEEEPIIHGGPLRWLQLWINPGKTTDKPSTQLIEPENIPVHKTENAVIRILAGTAFNYTSPLRSHWPLQYLHVSLHPKNSIELPLADPSWQGFIYILGGEGQFGQNKIPAKQRDCLVFNNEMADSLHVTNTSQNTPLDFVLLCGKPQQKPFYKILCGGGALIAESDKAARDAAACYESNPEHF